MAGVLAGELAAPARSAPLLFVFAAALAALWLAGRRRRTWAAWLALALAAVALGAHRMSGVRAPIFPPEHVARLTRPLRTTLEGRVSAAPERRDRRTVLLVEAEAPGWRARLAAAIGAAVAAPAGPVLQALIVGEEGEVDAELRDAFSRAGVIHILSISGLHVGLVAAAGFAVVRWLLSRSEWLVLAVDVERVAALASLGPVALYTGLAGLGVATLRSTIMVVVAVLAGLAGRRVDVLRSLAVAAVVLALAWPGAPLEISFQLSFVSVLAIVLGARRFGPQAPGGGWRARLRAAALVSPSALAGTAPPTAFHFP